MRFEHVAVDFHLGADKMKFSTRLPSLRAVVRYDVAQAAGERIEADRARAHQAFLQLGVDARLPLQRGPSPADEAAEGRPESWLSRAGSRRVGARAAAAW